MDTLTFAREHFAERHAASRFRQLGEDQWKFSLKLMHVRRECRLMFDGVMRLQFSACIGRSLGQTQTQQFCEQLVLASQSCAFAGEINLLEDRFFWHMATGIPEAETAAREMLDSFVVYADIDLPRIDMAYGLVRLGRDRGAIPALIQSCSYPQGTA